MRHVYITALLLSATSIGFAQNGEFHLDKVYKVSKTGSIDLSSSDAKVFITGSLRPDAHIKIDRKVVVKGLNSSQESFNVEVEADNGDIKIREHQKSFNSGAINYYKEEYKIEIEAPEGASLVIRGDDGDYYIKNINGAISLSIDDADAELAGCKGNKFSFRLDDGNIRMDKGRGSLEISADDGDVEIYHGQFSSIYADMDDGDLMIETSLTDDGNYNIKSEDGSVTLSVISGGGEFDIRHDDGHVMAQGNFKTLLETEEHTKLALSNGHAKISLRADDARVKLSAEN